MAAMATPSDRGNSKCVQLQRAGRCCGACMSDKASTLAMQHIHIPLQGNPAARNLSSCSKRTRRPGASLLHHPCLLHARIPAYPFPCRVCFLLSHCNCAGPVRAAVPAAAGHPGCCRWRQQQQRAGAGCLGAAGQPARAVTLPAGTNLRQGVTQVGTGGVVSACVWRGWHAVSVWGGGGGGGVFWGAGGVQVWGVLRCDKRCLSFPAEVFMFQSTAWVDQSTA